MTDLELQAQYSLLALDNENQPSKSLQKATPISVTKCFINLNPHYARSRASVILPKLDSKTDLKLILKRLQSLQTTRSKKQVLQPSKLFILDALPNAVAQIGQKNRKRKAKQLAWNKQNDSPKVGSANEIQLSILAKKTLNFLRDINARPRIQQKAEPRKKNHSVKQGTMTFLKTILS